MKVKWLGKTERKVDIDGDGYSATFLFLPDKEKDVPDAVWPALSKKMSDALKTGVLVVIDKMSKPGKTVKSDKPAINLNPFAGKEKEE